MSFAGMHPRYPFMLALSQATSKRLLTEVLEAAGGEVERGVKMIEYPTGPAALKPCRSRPRADSVRSLGVRGCCRPMAREARSLGSMTAVSCRWRANCDNRSEGLSRGISMNNYMVVKQRVNNLAQFQAAFDELRPMRERYGLHDVGQYRSADEADTVIVILEVTDLARAKEYWHSDVLAEGRRKAGAVGPLLAGVDQVWLTNGTVRAGLGEV
jgi:hypothetical protein